MAVQGTLPAGAVAAVLYDSTGAVVPQVTVAPIEGGVAPLNADFVVQGTTQKTPAPATSVANTAQTVTLAAVAAKRITVRKIVLFSSAAGAATLVLQEGGVTVVNFGTITTAAEAKVFDILYTGATNTALQVVVGAAGAAVTTTVSVVADAA